MQDLTQEELRLWNGDGYKGNERLRRAGFKVGYTAEQALEVAKCIQDPIYFCEKYVKITTLDHGIQPFIPRDYQIKTIQTLCSKRFTILKWPRQAGKTTTVGAIIAWHLLFNKEYQVACLAHKQEQAIEIIDRVKTIWEGLPLWLQHGITAWNKKSIELENKSKVFAAATSSGSVRGKTLNFVYADEFAIVEHNIQEEFYTGTFPTISSGTDSKFVISSTPKGFNLFYKLWTDAVEKRSDFVPIEINYWDVPGRDKAWAEKEKRRIGEAKFRQEYETEFQGSSNTLIDGKKLGMIPYIQPVMMDPDEHLHIFHKPDPTRQYVLCADVSEGVGGDFSTFSVIDVTEIPFRVVATYANDMITPMMFPNVIYDVAQYFNNAYVVIEANTIGAEVANILFYDLEYENILSSNVKSKRGDIDEVPRSFLGIKTTKKTKHLGCSNLKMLIENDQLIINDYRLFYELSRFIRKGATFKAEEGEHDDLVMTLVTFAWLATQSSFKELTNTDLRNALNQRKINEQEHLPLGVHVGFQQDQEVKTMALSEFDRWLMD